MSGGQQGIVEPAFRTIPKGQICFIIWRIEVRIHYASVKLSIRNNIYRILIIEESIQNMKKILIYTWLSCHILTI